MKKNVKFDVVRICAVGCDKNFITINYLGVAYTFYTKNRDLYNKLKQAGVPTSQSLTCNFKKKGK